MQIDINNPVKVFPPVKEEDIFFKLQSKMNILFKNQIKKAIKKNNNFHVFIFDYYGECKFASAKIEK